MKIFTVIGARPQFVKASVMSRAFAATDSGMRETIVHTGQHYDPNMSDVFFSELDIPRPTYNLGVGGGTHGENTGRMLEKLEALMVSEKPDWVLVYGDTDSTLAGGLAASKLHIPVAHIEAGLRSFNRRMPEEINRVLTDHVASLLLTPTILASNNLRKEGISENAIRLVGDVMYDASLFYSEHACKPEWFDRLSLELGAFFLCTIHRAENTDDPIRLRGILEGLGSVNQPVLLPIHPRTRKKLEETSFHIPANICVLPPVGYLEMTWLEINCKAVVTDSGGVQKEAYFHRKPCITLRDETEWVELVDAGFNTLVGSDPERIRTAMELNKLPTFLSHFDIYGDGFSASKILTELANFSIG